MGFEEFLDLAGTVEGAYAIGGATALLGSVWAHARGKRSRTLKLAQIGLETERAKLGQIEAQSQVELERLRYAEAAKQYERDTARRATLRAEELEDSKRAREDSAEKRRYELERLDRLVQGIRPVVEKYFAGLEASSMHEPVAQDQNLVNQRTGYRTQLVDEFLEKIGEDNSITDDGYDIGDGDIERISRIVDAKYPLPSKDGPEMPKEIRELLGLWKDYASKVRPTD